MSNMDIQWIPWLKVIMSVNLNVNVFLSCKLHFVLTLSRILFTKQAMVWVHKQTSCDITWIKQVTWYQLIQTLLFFTGVSSLLILEYTSLLLFVSREVNEYNRSGYIYIIPGDALGPLLLREIKWDYFEDEKSQTWFSVNVFNHTCPTLCSGVSKYGWVLPPLSFMRL